MIEIRKAESKDVLAVYELGKNVQEFHTSDRAPTFWPEVVLRDCCGKDDVYFFVALEHGVIIGFIIANLNMSLRKVLIENIFVMPDFRGQGIGMRLARQIVEAAKADSYEFISVLTPPDDIGAIKTYKKAGFVTGETFLWLDA